jgi:hypothetical protein
VNALRLDPAFTIELSDEEILEDLCWPHPPPGHWSVEPPNQSSIGRPTVSASRIGGSRSVKRASGCTPSASRSVL